MNHKNGIIGEIDFDTEVFDLLLQVIILIGQFSLYSLKSGAQNRKQVNLHECKKQDTDDNCQEQELLGPR